MSHIISSPLASLRPSWLSWWHEKRSMPSDGMRTLQVWGCTSVGGRRKRAAAIAHGRMADAQRSTGVCTPNTFIDILGHCGCGAAQAWAAGARGPPL